jgi:hypothetical protein
MVFLLKGYHLIYHLVFILGNILRMTDRIKNFKGQMILNPSTGLVQEKLPKKHMYFNYFLSFLESLPIIVASIFIKIIFLNL